MQGKLIGAGVGLVMGGGLGALIGALAGHQLFDARESKAKQRETSAQKVRDRIRWIYVTSAFLIMGRLAKADGQVKEKEIKEVRQIMGELDLDKDLKLIAQKRFNLGKDPEYPIDEAIKSIRETSRKQRDLRRRLLEHLLRVAFADGEIHADEQFLLTEVQVGLRFPTGDYLKLEQIARQEYRLRTRRKDQRTHQSRQERPYYSQRPTMDTQIRAAYDLLGVSSQISDEDLRVAYRRKLSQHHPDKLFAKGLPEEMMKAAALKTQEFREAYELIRASRAGFRR